MCHYEVPRIDAYITFYLEQDLRPLYRRSDKRGGYRGQETGSGKLWYRKLLAGTVGRQALDEQLGHIIGLHVPLSTRNIQEQRVGLTQKETAKMGVTPSNGGTTPR